MRVPEIVRYPHEIIKRNMSIAKNVSKLRSMASSYMPPFTEVEYSMTDVLYILSDRGHAVQWRVEATTSTLQTSAIIKRLLPRFVTGSA